VKGQLDQKEDANSHLRRELAEAKKHFEEANKRLAQQLQNANNQLEAKRKAGAGQKIGRKTI